MHITTLALLVQLIAPGIASLAFSLRAADPASIPPRIISRLGVPAGFRDGFPGFRNLFRNRNRNRSRAP
jgi:hypothetical protein